MSSISLNTNLASLATQRRIGETTSSLRKSFERLSSGLRITKSSDDAAGLAVADSLRADSQIYSQGIRNLNDGISLTNIADSALTELSSLVTRIRELAEQSANGTLGNQQRRALDAEAQALAEEYFRVSRETGFNNQKLFDGSLQGLRLQGSYGQAGGIEASLGGKLGTGTFSVAFSATAGAFTLQDVETADFNNDGILDIVASSVTGLSVRLGLGDATFGTSTQYASTPNVELTLGDVNNDGVTDLAYASVSAGKGYAAIRLGIGDGTFSGIMSFAMDAQTSSGVTLADLNNDGHLDLITCGRDGSGTATAAVRLGSGNGAFGALTAYTFGFTGSAKSVSAGDINGDGNLDLLVAGMSYDPLGIALVALGRGDGTFGSPITYDTEPEQSVEAVLADLNHDGRLDLITGGDSNSTGYATVRFGNGNGMFAGKQTYEMNSHWTFDMVLGDLNGDGNLDIASAGYEHGETPTVTIRLGRSDGTFGEATSSAVGGRRPRGIASGDYNQDGVLDVLTVGDNGFEGQLNVFTGDTREGVSPILPFSLVTRAEALQAIPMLRKTQDRVSTQLGAVGALRSRLDTAISNLQVSLENYDSARSQITDIDVASESAQLLRFQILQNAASAILSQANQAPALALKLLSESKSVAT